MPDVSGEEKSVIKLTPGGVRVGPEDNNRVSITRCLCHIFLLPSSKISQSVWLLPLLPVQSNLIELGRKFSPKLGSKRKDFNMLQGTNTPAYFCQRSELTKRSKLPTSLLRYVGSFCNTKVLFPNYKMIRLSVGQLVRS